MFICDSCGREFDFVDMIGDVVLCAECAEQYDEQLVRCRSKRDYDQLARKIRAEVIGSGGKVR